MVMSSLTRPFDLLRGVFDFQHLFNSGKLLYFAFVKQMRVSEFAKKVKKTRFTVYNWIKNHQLPTGVKATTIAGRLIIEVDEDFRNE